MTVQKARTMGHLNFGVGAFYESANLDLSGSANAKSETDEGLASGSITLGLGKNFEVSASTPYSRIDFKKSGSNQSGLGDGIARLKWNFLSSETYAIRLSAIASVTLPVGDKDKGLGTGKSDPGFAIALDKEYGSITWHALIGYLKRQEENVDNQVFYGGGVEYMPINNVSLITEVSGYAWTAQVAGRDDSTRVMVGGRYYIGDWASLTLGYGSWGGGTGPSSPNYMYMAGVTVGLGMGQPKKSLGVTAEAEAAKPVETPAETKPADAGTGAAGSAKGEGDGAKAGASTTTQEKAPEAEKITIVLDSVHYEFDKSRLLPEATEILKRNAEKLKANPTAQFVIEGRTCSIGAKGYNQKLGLRRALAAKKFLVEQGIAADRMEIISYGEDRPVHDNKTKEGRKLNRRADFVIKVK
ncbi:MAG: OmpA family protein [Nitrospinae bacterium]|nr:OmpA family protein [Nitrospinota bacterium]MBF0634147.1 OmpA family protein [Nitrospinota bacterium]